MGLGGITLGTIYVFSDYMSRVLPSADGPVGEVLRDAVVNRASAERVFQLLDEPREPEGKVETAAAAAASAHTGCAGVPAGFRGDARREAATIGEDDGRRRARWLRGGVRRRDLRLRRGDRAYRDVSFKVGARRAGSRSSVTRAPARTTTLKLLARLYELQEGSIRVDGRDIRDIPKPELRRRMAFVLQDVFLFDGDLRYNIVLGRDVADDVVDEAARATHVDDLIERLPNGWAAQGQRARRELLDRPAAVALLRPRPGPRTAAPAAR